MSAKHNNNLSNICLFKFCVCVCVCVCVCACVCVCVCLSLTEDGDVDAGGGRLVSHTLVGLADVLSAVGHRGNREDQAGAHDHSGQDVCQRLHLNILGERKDKKL